MRVFLKPRTACKDSRQLKPGHVWSRYQRYVYSNISGSVTDPVLTPDRVAAKASVHCAPAVCSKTLNLLQAALPVAGLRDKAVGHTVLPGRTLRHSQTQTKAAYDFLNRLKTQFRTGFQRLIQALAVQTGPFGNFRHAPRFGDTVQCCDENLRIVIAKCIRQKASNHFVAV